ncbi:MAG: MFS transporter [Rhodospirillaceae bacterium]|nr:MFS transporter [Rhodospirillaceae bacterium]
MTDTTATAAVIPKASDSLTPTKRMLIMTALVLSTVLASLDSSFVPIAFPDMIDNLDTSTAMVVWVALGYLIAATGPQLFLSRIGDVVGQVRMFQIGTTVYALAMIACTFAPTIEVLISLRVIQGLGMAIFLPFTFALATKVYPPSERGKALGIMQSANAFGFIAGPVFAGVLLDAFDWNAIFAVRIPFAIAAIAIAWTAFGDALPKADVKRASTYDLAGAILLTIGFFGLLFGFNRLPVEDNHLEITAWLIFISGFVFFGLFLVQENRSENPIVPLHLFKNANFTKAAIAFTAVFASFPVYLFVMPILLITGMEIKSWTVGMVLCSSAITTAVISPYAGKLADKFGAETLCFAGTLFAAAGYLSMLFIHLDTSVLYLLVPMILLGIGTGLFFSPNNSLLISNVPPNMAAIASGMIGTLRQAGYAVGFAVIASMVTALQDTYEASITKFSVTSIPNTDAHTISEFFEYGGVWSPEMLVSMFHMTVIVCTAMLLIAILNSVPKLKLDGFKQLAALGFAAVMGVGGILVFGAVSEIDSRLMSETVPTARAHTDSNVQAWAWKTRQHDIPGKVAPANAKQAFIDNCSACHGDNAQGLKGQGANLVASAFVKRLNDKELAAFIKSGRQPDSPDSTMKLLMPAFDYLTDEEIEQVIAYVRSAK